MGSLSLSLSLPLFIFRLSSCSWHLRTPETILDDLGHLCSQNKPVITLHLACLPSVPTRQLRLVQVPRTCSAHTSSHLAHCLMIPITWLELFDLDLVCPATQGTPGSASAGQSSRY